MKKSVFIIMLILVAVLSVCGNRNGGVKLTDEQLAERFVEDEFPGENLEIKIKESEDKDFVGYDVYSFFYPRLENRTEVTRNHDIFVSEKLPGGKIRKTFERRMLRWYWYLLHY